MRRAEFGKAGSVAYRYSSVVSADFSRIEALHAVLTLSTGLVLELTGSDALEAAYVIHPSVVEGKRMRFARHAWAVHNLIGHPLMQLFAFCKRYDKAMAIHEATVPTCKGPK